MTLVQAYERALERQESLQIGEAEMRAAQARYLAIAGSRWPELSAVAAGSAEEDTGDNRGEPTESFVGINARWTVFQGFRTVREGEALKAEERALGFDNERRRQLLLQDVADVFYQCLAYEDELAALADETDALLRQVEVTRERVKLGRSREADLLSARTQLANLQVTVAQIRGLLAASRELLAFLVGRPVNGVTLVDETSLPEPAGLEAALTAAANRPDALAAAARVQAAEQSLEAQQADRQPVVTAEANAYAWMDPDDDPAWDASIRASLPLFDKGVRRANEAERAEAVRISELRLDEVRRIASRDVRLATVELDSLLTQRNALFGALSVAEETVLLKNRDFELGRASQLDTLVAIAQWHNLRRRLASLDMLARAAAIRVHVAAGTAPP